MGRQCGKTLLVASIPRLYEPLETEHANSHSQLPGRQSKLLLRYLRFFLMRHEDEAYRENIESASVKHLAFKNGTRIDAMPAAKLAVVTLRIFSYWMKASWLAMMT